LRALLQKCIAFCKNADLRIRTVKLRLSVSAATSTIATLLVLFIVTASRSFAADSLLPLNLGVMGGDATAEGYYAQDMGFFKAEGLDVKMTTMLNGAALTSAMSSGALDIGIASVGVVAMAHEHNLPMRFAACAHHAPNGPEGFNCPHRSRFERANRRDQRPQGFDPIHY
jgi:ABC-type nitrate/sulfonate/bicarbonate transport system substrate-binding protein